MTPVLPEWLAAWSESDMAPQALAGVTGVAFSMAELAGFDTELDFGHLFSLAVKAAAGAMPEDAVRAARDVVMVELAGFKPVLVDPEGDP